MAQIIALQRPSVSGKHVELDVDQTMRAQITAEGRWPEYYSHMRKLARSEGVPDGVQPREVSGENPWDRDKFIFEWWVIEL